MNTLQYIFYLTHLAPGAREFWHFLWELQNYTGGDQCIAVTQSTHSTAATANGEVYGGSCLQAFLIALYSHGQIAWEYITNYGQVGF
jgi:hypothetical protein